MLNWVQRRAHHKRFEELVLPYLDALHYAALRLTKDESAADDLVQETFLRAYRALNQLTQEESCRAWVMKIMTNIWLNQLQRRRREATSLDVYELDPSHEQTAAWGHHSIPKAPEAVVIQKRFCEDVEQALQKLPPAFRIVVMLADVEGFSYKEVAEMVACPIGTVMSRLSRGRGLLQKALSVYARGERDRSSARP